MLIFSGCVFLRYVFNRGKRWDEALERPDLDYRDIYDENVGQIPGN